MTVIFLCRAPLLGNERKSVYSEWPGAVAASATAVVEEEVCESKKLR